MILNKEKQRERLLQILSDAPTEILLNAVEDLKAFKQRQSEAMASVFKYFGDGKAASTNEAGTPATESVDSSPKPEAKSKVEYIDPPHAPASKIGSDAESAALAWLRNGPANLEQLSVAMKRSSAQAGPLLARLVVKGKIAYRSDKLYCAL